MEGQSLSSRARATLHQGESNIPGNPAGAGTDNPMPKRPGIYAASESSGGSDRSGEMSAFSSQVVQQISQRPWTSMALALAAGYAMGSLGGSSSGSETRPDPEMYFGASRDTGASNTRTDTSPYYGPHTSAASGATTQHTSAANRSPEPPRPPEPGMFSQLTSQFDDQITTMKDTLLSTVLGLVHDTIQQDAPRLHQEIERVRRERGGQASTSWAGASSANSSAQTDRSKDVFRKEHEQDMY